MTDATKPATAYEKPTVEYVGRIGSAAKCGPRPIVGENGRHDDPVACFKHGCSRWAVTWELDASLDHACANALCAEHAVRPSLRGSLLHPTIVPGHRP